MKELTGGCQCGAVRYRLLEAPSGASICHCRMCQKAFGSYFAPLAGVPPAKLEWTRGAPAIYRSSQAAERGFCAACGTPLTFHYVGSNRISVSLGSLDDPSLAPPERAYGLESKLGFFAALDGLPGTRTEEDVSPQELERMKPLAREG
jgi:hypothetical protein